MNSIPGTQSADVSQYAASAKSTGGGGFNHEDEVVAYYLVLMLTGAFPFRAEHGIITQVKFQTKVDGWLLDDVLLALTSADGVHRCALSIKSNPQFAADHAAPADFVHDCWEQASKGPPMVPTGDFLALAVSGVPPVVVDDFDTLRGLAEGAEPGTLEARLRVKGFVDNGKRRMAASFVCPADIALAHPSASVADPASIISRIFILDFDFPSASSRSRREALKLCEQALDNRTSDATTQLWEDMCMLAREFRPKAGMLDLPRLVARLRSRHDLARYPSHRGDWEQIDRYTNASLSEASRWTLAGKMSLLRLPLHKKLNETIQRTKTGESPAIPVLVGRSGDGKSVVARQWLLGGSPQVWLDARLFESSHGQNPMAAAEDRLKVKHPLAEIFQSATGRRPRLVLDGIGRLFDEHFLNAVVCLAREAVEAGWEVVANCQDDDWDRAARVFSSAGLGALVVQIEPLTNAELRDVAKAEPRLRSLLSKADVRRVLARPKYLDVVLQGAASNDDAAFSEADQWTGEAHVALWCWKRVVEGLPPRTVRSAAAKQMALKQADAVRDSVAEDELDAAHLPAIDELIADGVCRKVGERIIFDHDLLGVWGRQRVLLAQPSIAAFIRSPGRGISPLWLRAIRLWALDVLEQQGDHAKWISAVRELAASGEMAASDRALEAVALSAGAVEHLEKVWSEICGQDKLLRRLLERFLRSATVPNPGAMQALAKLADGAEDDLNTWVASECRVPEIAYWPALLTVLHRHSDDVSRLAPNEAARVARLWLLSTTPDMPFRKEAAQIALAIAQHVYQVLENRKSRQHWSDGLDEWSLCHKAESNAYSAALTAAPVLPTEVAAFALRAASRRSDPDVHEPEEPGVVYAEPWPDGPSDQVCETFRDAVLRLDTFLPILAVAPDVAKEVLLAVLLKPPVLLKHPGMMIPGYDDDDEMSIVDVSDWSPPFYTRGPFLAFLHAVPNIAIDAIIRLVNFATDRWVDQKTREVHPRRGIVGPPRPVRVRFSNGGDAVNWHGDVNVYVWYQGDPRAPAPVASALMALEKWLYNRLDGGNNVTDALNQIKQNATSIAFAGLLSAVGRHHPVLLKGSLSFLLGIPEFMYWDADPKQQIVSTAIQGWRMFAVREPSLSKDAEQWYAMPHRKTDLFTIAKWLFLNDVEIGEIQAPHVLVWRQRLESGCLQDEAQAINLCIRTFDIDNWEIVEAPNGQKGWRLRLTPEEREVNKRELQEAQDQLLIIQFPHRCRDLLDRQGVMTPEELERFWKDLQRISPYLDDQHNAVSRPDVTAPPNSDDVDFTATEARAAESQSILGGMMGGIAVLLLRHREWLDQHRMRKAWVLRQLRRVPQTRVPRSALVSMHPDKHDDNRWDCFFAAVVVDFLCRNPSSFIWRWHTALLATGFHYSPVRHLFAFAYRRRAELDGGFEKLCHLLLRWSAVRWHAEHSRNGWQINVDVRSEWNRVIDDFLMDRLTGLLPSFAELAASPRELSDKPETPVHFRRNLDVPLIASAFHNILRVNEAIDEEERTRWLCFWRDLLTWRLTPPADRQHQAEVKDAEDDGDDDRWPRNKSPYPSDGWLLDRIADVAIQLRSTENHQLFWQQLLDLVPDRQPWAEHFLTTLFLEALGSQPVPPAFPSLWKAMLDYASNSLHWTKANDDGWAHLLGFDHLLCDSWEERHAPLLRVAQPHLESFVRSKMCSGWKMRELLNLLKTPSAEEVRVGFLVAFADAFKQHPNLLKDDDDSAATAKFLDFCLHHHQSTIMSDSRLFGAFSELLGSLVALQQPIACELQDRLRRS